MYIYENLNNKDNNKINKYKFIYFFKNKRYMI